MKISTEGLLVNHSYIPSPNCDELPGVIDSLVIHNISLPPGQFGGEGIAQLFTNQLDPTEHPYYATVANLKVSAHALIRRDGTVIQFVPLTKRAWHAGKSNLTGRENCNDFAVGIELEGTDDESFTEAQYQQLAELTHAICQFYPTITPERIVGHSDIAPGRKTDPGPHFDWGKYRAYLKKNG
jgi:AmpD protein